MRVAWVPELLHGQRLFSTLSDITSLPPRRALLYIPGTDERKMIKAATELVVDCICLDCEDGVAVNRKDEARNTVAKVLSDLDFGKTNVVARINSVATGLAGQDIDTVLSGSKLPAAVVLPKVERASEVRWLQQQISKLTQQRHGNARPPAIITMCETPLGLLNLREVLEAASDSSADGPRGEACIFGADDYAAAVGATRSSGSAELAYARQAIVAHCRAFGMQPIDIVKIDFTDREGLKAEAMAGAAMGFAGKQVIHPKQVEMVQAAFTPTDARVAEAKELLEAHQQHQRSGRGAFTLHGRMVDMPTVLQAMNVLALAGLPYTASVPGGQ